MCAPPSGRVCSRTLVGRTVPKTAGTAIEELGLSRRVCWGMNNHKFDSVDRPLGCAKWHTPTRFFSGRVPGKDSPDPFANSTTFCIKRHPFTRAISQCAFLG